MKNILEQVPSVQLNRMCGVNINKKNIDNDTKFIRVVNKLYILLLKLLLQVIWIVLLLVELK